MKRLTLILIMSTLTHMDCLCQTLPTKKEQYNFLRWYIETKKPKTLWNIIIRFDENMVVLSPMKFNNSNIKYLEKQMGKYAERALLDTTMLKENCWSVKADTNRSTIFLSIPIFSINKKIAAIHWETSCGWECGGDHIEVYEKNKSGRWVISKRRIISIYQ